MSLKGFHIVFIIFSTLLALGVGLCVVWVDLVEGAPIYLAGAIASFVSRRCVDRLWRLVLPQNETAADHHMKTKILSALLLFIFSPVGQELACPFCYEREGRKIDRAHGGRDLVSVRRRDVGPGWDRSIQFSTFGDTGACLPSRIRKSPRKI